MAFFDKSIRSLPTLTLEGRHVKRYEVVTPELGIDRYLRDAAQRYVPRLYPDFVDDATPPVTVTVLHRGPNGMYLNAYSWVWDNVLHCRTAAAGDQPFLGSYGADLTDYTELNKPLIGCVWELPPIEYERRAWIRHILEPERQDLAAYLAETLPDGPVGRAAV